MPRHVLVTTNCQTAGIAATLRACLPGAEVTARFLATPQDAASTEALAALVAQADAWVLPAGHKPWLAEPPFAELVAGKQVVHVPQVGFDAFHPDLVYVRDRRTGGIVKPDYHSRLVIRAWELGVAAERVPLLFTEPVMRALGYCNRWAGAQAALKMHFDASCLDFASFFLAAKRLGVFMHSINHPAVEITTLLGKMVALRLGVPGAVMARPLPLPDPLLPLVVWPVHPPIAHALGVPGSDNWAIGHDSFDLPGYIAYAYAGYAACGASPDDMAWARPELGPPPDVLDAVMLDALGGHW